MNKDQIKGQAKKVQGKVKEVAGKIVGNEKLKAEGKVDKVLGKAQSAYGDLKDAVENKR